MRRYAAVLISVISLIIPFNAFPQSENKSSEYSAPWIEAYAGIGYYNWSLAYLGGSSFNTDVDPYILKKFEIKTDLRLLKFALNYFTNRFTNLSDSTDDAEVEKKSDPLARQLALLAGIELGPVFVSADAKFRKFQGTVKSKGIDYSGTIVPVRLYTETGPVDLDRGEEMNWYTIVKDYTLKVGTPRERRKGANFAMEFGGRMLKYRSPVEIEIEQHGGSAHTDALFESDMTQYFIGFSFWMNYTWDSGFYWDWSLPAYLGANRMENAYLDMGPGNTYTFSSSGNLATGYRVDNVKLELGFDYDFFICNSMDTTSLKRDLDYYSFSSYPGTVTMAKGTSVDAKWIRMELFWGVYLHATLMW